MNKIFLGLFLFYLTSGFIKYIGSNGIPSKECYICDTYAFCGYNLSNLPACLNGSRCREDQQRACEEIFLGNSVEVCDRPGIFPDPDSPENFYKCWTSNSPKIIKQKKKCPENTMFHREARLCLNEAERKILKQIEGFPPVEKNEHPGISCKKSGFYAYPLDCKRYYYCNEKNLPQIFECPFGTYYHYKKKNCTTKLTSHCKSQLNKIAKIEKLNSVRLLTKIKKMNKNQIPPGLCMRFCENNWMIITEDKPEVDYVTERASPEPMYKVSLVSLDGYEESALKLNKMIDDIIEEKNEEDEEEKEEDENEQQSNNIMNSKRHKPHKGIRIKLILKALLHLIKNIKSFLRKYIRENICPNLTEPNSYGENIKSTTQNHDYSKPEISNITMKPFSSYTVQDNSTTTTILPELILKLVHDDNTIESYTTTTPRINYDYDTTFKTNNLETFCENTKTQLPDLSSTQEPMNFDTETDRTNAESKSQFTLQAIKFQLMPLLETSYITTDTSTFGTTTSSDHSVTFVHSPTSVEHFASVTTSENHDSTEKTTIFESLTSLNNSDSTTEAEEFDSSTSKHSSSFTQMGSPTSFESSASDAETTESDSATESEHSSFTTETKKFDSHPTLENSVTSTEKVPFDPTTSSEFQYSSTMTKDSSLATTSQNSNSPSHTGFDSVTSSQYFPSATEAGDFGSSMTSEHSDSTISNSSFEKERQISNTDITTETQPHKANKTLSPFCEIIEAKSKNSNEESEWQP